MAALTLKTPLRLRGLRAAACSACCALLFASALQAQPTRLPETLITKNALTAADREQVREYAAHWVERLREGDAAEIEEARDQIMLPFLQPNSEPSVQFRIEMARAVAPALGPLVDAEEDHRAVNAAIVAGALAVDESFAVLSQALQDPRESVRIGAASGAERLMRSVALSGPRAESRQALAKRIHRLLGSRLAEEENPIVADALVGALASMPVNAELHVAALAEMVKNARRYMDMQRQQEADLAAARPAVRALQAVRSHLLTDPTFEDRALLTDATRLAGVTLSFAREHLVNMGPGEFAAMTEAERTQLAAVLDWSEDLAVQVAAHLTGQPAAAKELPDALEEAFEAGDPAPAIEAIEQWTGAGGRLAKAPFGLDPTEF